MDGNPQYVVLMLSKMALLVCREIVHDDHRRRRVDDEGMGGLIAHPERRAPRVEATEA